MKAITILVCCNYCVFVLYNTSLDKTDDNTMCVLCIGTITQWYATSGSLWSPFLQGGMKYSNGYITVPQHSLYYVYAQLSYQNISLCYQAGFSIQVNWNSRAWTFSYTQESANFHTHYMGRIISLNKGDSLSLYVTNSCYYIFSSLSSFFGAFKL